MGIPVVISTKLRWVILITAIVSVSVGCIQLTWADSTGGDADSVVRQQMADSGALDLGFLAEISGRQLDSSPNFTVVSTPDMRLEDSREDRLSKFLAQFDERGFQAVRILLTEVGPVGPYWRVDFPGCVPGGCTSIASSQQFHPSDKSEFDSGRTDSALNEYYQLDPIFVQGVRFDRDLAIFFDLEGRLLKARLSVYRDSKGSVERLANQLSSGGAFEGVLVYEETSIFAAANQ